MEQKNKNDVANKKKKKIVVMWKIVGTPKVSVLYIYIDKVYSVIWLLLFFWYLFSVYLLKPKFSSDTRFWLEKKKIKIKIKILPPPSGFRAFLPPLLLLNFSLFFFLFFFFFFWFRSATWLPLLLYLCVLAVLHLCLEFKL